MSVPGNNNFEKKSFKTREPLFKEIETSAREQRQISARTLGGIIVALIFAFIFFVVLTFPAQMSTSKSASTSASSHSMSLSSMTSSIASSAGSKSSSNASASSNSRLSSSSTSSTATIPESTKNRKRLSPLLAQGSQYYTDEDGTHIKDPLLLEKGLISFYEKTGVKPYLYILSKDSDVFSSTEGITQKGIQLYDELFDDEAHLLILYYENGSRFFYHPFVGRDAHTVIDNEADDILQAYILTNNAGSRALERVFSDSFTQTAERIMSQVPEPSASDASGSSAPPNPAASIAVIMLGVGGMCAVVAIVRLARMRRRAKREAEQEEAERRERILCAPIRQLDDMIAEEQQNEGDHPASDEAERAPATQMQERKHRWVTVLIASIALVVIGVLLLLLPYDDGSENAEVPDPVSDTIPASTIERTPLPIETTEDIEYYTDEQGGFFYDTQKLEAGLSEFYAKTGVRPYVYIAPKNVTSSSGELYPLVDQKYRELFDDDDPVIFMICCVNPTEVNIMSTRNNAAQQVIDDEAWEIMKAYFGLYSDGSLKLDEDVLSKTFVQTADRIMSKPAEPEPTRVSTTTMIIGGCIAGVIVVTAIVLIVRSRRWAKRKSEHAETRRTRHLLKKAALERFQDDGLEDLEEKYRNAPEVAPKKKPKKPRWATGPTQDQKTLHHLRQQLLDTFKKADPERQDGSHDDVQDQ